uniref:Uncharacterized protein n=1 Tax=Octopus bimaculoides TaxID=37653 RepID=A0A0L8H8V3_OCTBM
MVSGLHILEKDIVHSSSSPQAEEACARYESEAVDWPKWCHDVTVTRTGPPSSSAESKQNSMLITTLK